IEIGTVNKRVCLSHKPTIGSRVWTIRVGHENAGFGARNHRRDADKAVRRKRIDAKLIVRFSSVSIVSVQDKAAAHALVEADNKCVVSTAVPGTESVNCASGERRQKS